MGKEIWTRAQLIEWLDRIYEKEREWNPCKKIELLLAELEAILTDKENQTYRPLWMDLTPNGKTLVVVYPGKHQEEIAEAVIDKLGEPEAAGPAEEGTGNLLLLFPHQNLPEPLKDIAERMTTASLLEHLGVRSEGSITI